MFFKNTYIRYSSNAKSTFVAKTGFNAAVFSQILKASVGVLDDLILTHPFFKEYMKCNEQYEEYRPIVENSKHVYLIGVDRLAYEQLNKRYSSVHPTETYRTETYKLLENLFNHFGISFLQQKEIPFEVIYMNQFKQAITYHYLSNEKESKVFEILNNIVEKESTDSYLVRGYRGETCDISMESKMVVTNASQRNNWTLNTYNKNNKEVENILKYSMGLCIKSKNLQGLFYLISMSYSLIENKKKDLVATK